MAVLHSACPVGLLVCGEAQWVCWYVARPSGSAGTWRGPVGLVVPGEARWGLVVPGEAWGANGVFRAETPSQLEASHFPKGPTLVWSCKTV